MKISKIGTLLGAILLATLATFAQASIPQQWTIVTTSESTANASPITYTAAGVYSPCTTGQNDNSKDKNANCFNPLTITTDWDLSGLSSSLTITPIAADTFTNSSCSAMGGVSAITASGYSLLTTYTTTVTVTLIDGNSVTNTIVFTGKKSSNSAQFTGTFTSAGPCMKSDKGNFTATLFPTITGTFNGSFETNGSFNEKGTGGVSLALVTGTNFGLTGTAVALPSSGLCFSNLTIATTLGNTYMTSLATGDTLAFIATDLSGNVVLFTASGTSGTGQQEGDNAQGNQMLYVTYTGLAGACSGKSGVDIPFNEVTGPLAPGHGGVFGFGWGGPGGLGHMNHIPPMRRW